MSARDETLAYVYANALLDLAFEKGVHAEVLAELTEFAGVLAKETQFAHFLYAPNISLDAKKGVLDKAFGSAFSEVTLNFLRVVVDKRRQIHLPTIIVNYEEGYRERMGELVVQVFSAVELQDAQRKRLSKALKNKFSKDVILEEKVKPALLGGFVLKVADQRIDGSLRSRLETMGPGSQAPGSRTRTTMKIKADEISSVLKREIEDYARDLEMDETGSVLEVGDGIARIYGLKNCMSNELLEFPNDIYGLALNLEETSVGAVLLGDYKKLREGSVVKRTGKVMSVPVGEGMVGRVVNPLGEPIDNKGPIQNDGFRPLEIIAPGIAARQPVTEPLQVGLKAVDSMIPIGRGQRELIIGDRQTGKTAIAIDAIVNQKHSGVICVYVAVGQKESTVVGLVEKLTQAGAMDYTVVVNASAADPAPLKYIAPYAGTAIAEYFVYEQGKATLVVYDDLTKQAAAYRELSLLLRRPPGREAYPGDVFYLHSRLLERSCKMKDLWVITRKDAAAGDYEPVDGRIYERHEGFDAAAMVISGFNPEKFEARAVTDDDAALPHQKGKFAIFPKGQKVPLPDAVYDTDADLQKAFAGRDDKADLEVRKKMPSGGSLTALPVIETQEGEVSAYIPTNVISITDGQIYLEPNLFFSGIRPAINVGISVSRVGGNAQTKAMKSVAGTLKLDLASYWDLEAFAQLGTELDAVASRKLERGKRLVELLKQGQFQPMPFEEQVLMVYAGTKGFLDEVPVDRMGEFEAKFLPYARAAHSEIGQSIREEKKLTDQTKKNMDGVLKDFIDLFKQGKTPDPRSHEKKTSQLKKTEL